MNRSYGLSSFEYGISDSIFESIGKITFSNAKDLIIMPFTIMTNHFTDSFIDDKLLKGDYMFGDGHNIDVAKCNVSFRLVDNEGNKDESLAEFFLDETYIQLFIDDETGDVCEPFLRSALVKDNAFQYSATDRIENDRWTLPAFMQQAFSETVLNNKHTYVEMHIEETGDNNLKKCIVHNMKTSDFINAAEIAEWQTSINKKTRTMLKSGMWLAAGALAAFVINAATGNSLNIAHASVMAPLSDYISTFKTAANSSESFAALDTVASPIIGLLDLSTKSPTIALSVASAASAAGWIKTLFVGNSNSEISTAIKEKELNYQLSDDKLTNMSHQYSNSIKMT